MSGFSIFPLLAGDNNKGEYISNDQVEKYEREARINEKSFPEKTNQVLGNAKVPKKRIGVFVPEEKRDGKAIKERITNRLKVSSICINHETRICILNSYYSVENDTLLCDKFRIFQSSKIWMSNFMQSYNLINKNHRNEKYLESEEIRV